MAHKLFGLLIVCCAVRLWAAPTLADELRDVGIPETDFTRAELAENVNAASARQGTFTYLTYMQVRTDDRLTGFPQIIRYDASTGRTTKAGLRIDDPAECCGAPDSIDLTQSFLLLSFHNTPSASTVLVVNHELRPVALLFGFNFHEIAPDQVVFIENMVHFASAHPERLQSVNLQNWKNEELYPLKNDALRLQFANLHQQHMPPQTACQEANDPCDPDIYDETADFVSTSANGFRIRIAREAVHTPGTAAPQAKIPFQAAEYTYLRTRDGWRYCVEELVPATLIKQTEEAIPPSPVSGCQPNLAVEADPKAAVNGTPPAFERIVRNDNSHLRK